MTLPMAARGAGKATVRGAQAVNVRQAPGTDSPVLLSLQRGRQVTVERVVGDWALITLEGGRKGYVSATYLALPAGIEVVAASTATPKYAARASAALRTPSAPSPSPTTPATLPTMLTHTPAVAETAPGPEDLQADAGLQREVAELRQRLAALESAVVATPGGVASGMGEGSDPTTPMEAGEREPTRGAVFVPTVAQLPDPQEIGPSLAMAGVGLLIGFLLGAAYGQRQERQRRTRVRF